MIIIIFKFPPIIEFCITGRKCYADGYTYWSRKFDDTSTSKTGDGVEIIIGSIGTLAHRVSYLCVRYRSPKKSSINIALKIQTVVYRVPGGGVPDCSAIDDFRSDI